MLVNRLGISDAMERSSFVKLCMDECFENYKIQFKRNKLFVSLTSTIAFQCVQTHKSTFRLVASVIQIRDFNERPSNNT